MNDGRVGAVPDWYIIIQIAKFYGVAPWELLKQPPAWIEWGKNLIQIEGQVAQYKQQKQRMK